MDIRSTILARKYAQAFLNLYFDQITQENYSNMFTLRSYLQTHRNVLLYFSLPHIALEKKLDLFDQIETKIKPSEPFKELFETLIRHDRIMLAPSILVKICELYRERKNVMFFSIESSHELDAQTIATLETFLARHTDKKIESESRINHDLIAGIRLQSDTQLWEYSIRKQIHELTKLVQTKGY